MWPPPKPKLSQDEFDEAVQTNISDFEMSVSNPRSIFESALSDLSSTFQLQPEEAIKSACEEFTMQGYELKDVIKKVGGGNTDR